MPTIFIYYANTFSFIKKYIFIILLQLYFDPNSVEKLTRTSISLTIFKLFNIKLHFSNYSYFVHSTYRQALLFFPMIY